MSKKEYFSLDKILSCDTQYITFLERGKGKRMNAFDAIKFLDNLNDARICAGAEFERLCNNNQYIEACIFQSIRDSIAQNMQLLQSYIFCKDRKELINENIKRS